jgi:hypothetical protein
MSHPVRIGLKIDVILGKKPSFRIHHPSSIHRPSPTSNWSIYTSSKRFQVINSRQNRYVINRDTGRKPTRHSWPSWKWRDFIASSGISNTVMYDRSKSQLLALWHNYTLAFVYHIFNISAGNRQLVLLYYVIGSQLLNCDCRFLYTLVFY